MNAVTTETPPPFQPQGPPSAQQPSLHQSNPNLHITQNPVSSRAPNPALSQSMGGIPVLYPKTGSVVSSPHGSYTIQRVLGSGEFGAVFECIGPFDRIYALKIIRPANRPYLEVQAEWTKEVTRLLSLRHPNVVYIYDHFTENNLFYLALEACDHPLTAMLGTPLAEGLVLELARQLLAAVQFLHDNDVVHDDLHPGNVLVSHTDRPVVKIGDFGISQELRGAPAIRPDVVHHVIMAPEILASGYTSKQSDLYQVGLLLYWMLMGAPALPARLPYQELVRLVSEGEPRRRAEAIGTPLGALVAKLLRRREQYRYTSAREVWADLRQLPAWQTRQLFPPK